jgi:hypothetical protein
MCIRRVIRAAFLICLMVATATAQTEPRGIVLPETVADHARQLCSRPGPPKFDGTWTPTEKLIRIMESRFERISRLRTRSGIVGVRIKHPTRYYRQYLGIVVKKRKFIFINAFCDDTPPEFWHQELVDTCDGGCSWGVVYDVAVGKFSHLELNGIS